MTTSATEREGGGKRDTRHASQSTASPRASRLPSSRTSLLLLAGVVGGLVGAILGDRCFGVIPRQEMSAKYYQESEERWATLDFSPDVVAEVKLKNRIQLARNSALALGMIGAVLGGLFGLAAGTARKAWRAVAAGTFGGTLSGAVSGIGAGYAGVQMAVFLQRYQVRAMRPEELADAWLRQMYSSVAVHATEWCLVSLGVGLAVGLASAPPRAIARKSGFACLAGLLAAVAYTPLASLIFPSWNSGGPFPEGPLNRLMFVMLPGVALAVLLSNPASCRGSASSAPATPSAGRG